MKESPPAFALHESASPANRRGALLAALRGGKVPGWLLYRSPAQAERWLAYHQAWSPSRSDDSPRNLYGRAFRAAASRLHRERAIGSGRVSLVGLGSGGGQKDAALLAALAEYCRGPGGKKAELEYLPVDASAALVTGAARHARGLHPGLSARALVADLSLELPAKLSPEPSSGPGAVGGPAGWLAGAAAPGNWRVFSCFGLLPNMDHRVFPGWLAGLLRPGEWLLLSANLSPLGLAADRAPILPQYDNPLARAWYGGALLELGFGEKDFHLSVEARPLEAGGAKAGEIDPGEAWQVVVTALLERPVELNLAGDAAAFAAGDSLEVFFSNRFTARAAGALLERAGLRVLESWLHGSGEEGIFLCEAS